MSIETIQMTPELYEYFQKISIREPAILAKLRARTKSMPGAVMQICPEQGQFMALLMKMMGAKKTLEVGTYTGYSSLAVALALPDDGRVVACDINKECTEVAREFWAEAGVANKMDLRIGKGIEILDDLIANGQSGTFDFAFIDADKQNYSNYYEQSLKLARKGGVIAIDNVLWSGAVADKTNQEKATVAIRAFNKFILKDERVDISMLPIGDGLTLAFVK